MKTSTKLVTTAMLLLFGVPAVHQFAFKPAYSAIHDQGPQAQHLLWAAVENHKDATIQVGLATDPTGLASVAYNWENYQLAFDAASQVDLNRFAF